MAKLITARMMTATAYNVAKIVVKATSLVLIFSPPYTGVY